MNKPISQKERGKAGWLIAATMLAVFMPVSYILYSSSQAPARSIEEKAREDSSGTVDQITPTGTVDGKSPVTVSTVPRGTDEVESDEAWFAPWGSGEGELGRRIPQEGAPEGPMSFVIDAQGRTWVLDQVNSRVVVFEEGKPPRSVPIPAESFQDLQLTDGGDLVLLDRLARRSVAVVDPNGKLIREIDLTGQGVSEGGGVTAMFYQDDGVWVEVEHSRMVRVSDADGVADPDRPGAPGRFSPDGQWLFAVALDGRFAARIMVRSASEPADPGRLLARVPFAIRILHLVAFEFDGAGRMYLVARLARFRETEPFDVIEERLEVVVLAENGTEINRIRLPAPAAELEQFRSVFVGSDGTLYMLVLGENGATLRRIML